ncbi:hypothetical protein Cgig2_030655 [Carnegiea gigantea]|uniref:Uncharacterized protein n=1 Tax=Carnegiea gigantea TaxID=171969 RepID=A0A9Q1K3E7_9CARY|nr:hypothetical protein Cgig2_030655 [Carnegiea gigantea]
MGLSDKDLGRLMDHIIQSTKSCGGAESKEKGGFGSLFIPRKPLKSRSRSTFGSVHHEIKATEKLSSGHKQPPSANSIQLCKEPRDDSVIFFWANEGLRRPVSNGKSITVWDEDWAQIDEVWALNVHPKLKLIFRAFDGFLEDKGELRRQPTSQDGLCVTHLVAEKTLYHVFF